MTRYHKGAYMDVLMAQFNEGHMSVQQIKTVLGEKDEHLWEEVLKKKFIEDVSGLFYNEKLEGEVIKRRNFTESRRLSRTKADEDNVRIYLLKDLNSGYIKIGSSVNPLRRYNEITNQTVSAKGVNEDRNHELMWYSEPVERTKENEIHNQFDDKRKIGEWFDLSKEDIDTIKRTLLHTIARTENENENRNDNKNRSGKKKEPTSLTPFDEFYKAYPIHEAKQAAIKAWKKLNVDNGMLELILGAIKKQKAHREAMKQKNEFVPEWPHPASWLNGKRWEDEIPEVSETGTPYIPPIDEDNIWKEEIEKRKKEGTI